VKGESAVEAKREPGKIRTFFRKKIADNIIYLYFITFLLLLFGQILGVPAMFMARWQPKDVMETAALYFTNIGMWAALLLHFGLFRRNRPLFHTLGKKSQGNRAKLFLAGIGMGLGLNLICILPALLRGDIHISFSRFEPVYLLFIFAAVFIQSSAEELLCRGFLYQRLRRGYKNPWVAVIGNAAFFGVLHLGNNGIDMLSLSNIVIVGILFTLMITGFDSMWCAMAAHAAWNFNQNIIFGLPNSGIMVPYSVFTLDAGSAVNSAVYDVAFGVEGTILTTIVLIAACVLLYLWSKKHPITPVMIWEDDTHCQQAEVEE